jgi:hypothetical protein
MFISRKDAVTIEVIGFFGYSHDKRFRCIFTSSPRLPIHLDESGPSLTMNQAWITVKMQTERRCDHSIDEVQ